MGLPKNLPEVMKFKNQLSSVSITGAHGGNVNFTSVRNYQGVGILVNCGVLTSTAPNLTVNQAKNVEGNGNKAIAYDRYFKNVVGSSPDEESDRWDETTGAAGTLALATGTNYFIPILTDLLDVTNDFDCVRAMVSAPGTSLVLSIMILLWGGPAGLAGNVKHIPSAAVNRMQN